MKFLGLLLSLSLSSGMAFAQQRPDFSGRWTLASDPTSTAATSMTVEFWILDYRAQSEFIGVKRWFGDKSTEEFSIMLDNPFVQTPNRRDHFVGFEGQTLVIQRLTHTHTAMNYMIERSEIWSFNPDGLLRIVITDRPPTGEPVTTEVLYRLVEAK